MALDETVAKESLEIIKDDANRIESRWYADRSFVYGFEDKAVKRYMAKDMWSGFPKMDRIGDAVWEYVVGSYLADLDISVPEMHGVVVNRSRQASKVLEQLEVLLVMERIESAEQLPKTDRERIRNTLDAALDKAWENGLIPADIGGRNYLVDLKGELHLIDFVRWSAHADVAEMLLETYPAPIFDENGLQYEVTPELSIR